MRLKVMRGTACRLAEVVDEAHRAEQVDGAQVVDACRVVVVAVNREHGQAHVVVRILEVHLPANQTLSLMQLHSGVQAMKTGCQADCCTI